MTKHVKRPCNLLYGTKPIDYDLPIKLLDQDFILSSGKYYSQNPSLSTDPTLHFYIFPNSDQAFIIFKLFCNEKNFKQMIVHEINSTKHNRYHLDKNYIFDVIDDHIYASKYDNEE